MRTALGEDTYGLPMDETGDDRFVDMGLIELWDDLKRVIFSGVVKVLDTGRFDLDVGIR